MGKDIGGASVDPADGSVSPLRAEESAWTDPRKKKCLKSNIHAHPSKRLKRGKERGFTDFKKESAAGGGAQVTKGGKYVKTTAVESANSEKDPPGKRHY